MEGRVADPIHNLQPWSFVVSPLPNDRHGWRKRLTTTHRMDCPVYSTVLLCRSDLLMDIYMWHLHALSPCGEVYPHTSSQNTFPTSFPVMLFSRPWASSQPIGHSPWVSEQSYIWPVLLPNKIYGHVYCPEFWPLWRFPFSSVFHSCARKRL